MKKHYLAALLFLFYVGDAAALPDCPSSPSEIYHNCYGELTFDNGNKYIGFVGRNSHLCWFNVKQHITFI